MRLATKLFSKVSRVADLIKTASKKMLKGKPNSVITDAATSDISALHEK